MEDLIIVRAIQIDLRYFGIKNIILLLVLFGIGVAPSNPIWIFCNFTNYIDLIVIFLILLIDSIDILFDVFFKYKYYQEVEKIINKNDQF